MDIQEFYGLVEKHLLNDDKPSDFLNRAYNEQVFKKYPFNMLYRLRQTEQSPVHHPEGNVWNHTMLVVDEAARVKSKSMDKTVFMWASLLHDIGKPSTTRVRKSKITAYEHDKVGARLAKEFLTAFNKDSDFIKKVSELVRYHMHIFYVVKDLPFADIQGMRRDTEIDEVALLGLCDRLGRTRINRAEEERNIDVFLERSQDMSI